MKFTYPLRSLCTRLALALLLGFFAHQASAQIFANDEALSYAAWDTGTNYGFGFQPWVLAQSGTGGGNYTGFFTGNGGDPVASGNGNAWGMYANGVSGLNAVEAFRGFSNAMPVNATFKIRWHNKGTGGSATPPYHVGGFSLRNGNSASLMSNTTFLNDGVRFALYYGASDVDNFSIYDGNSVYTIPLGFGSNPVLVEFTLLPGDLYNLTIKNAAGNTVLYTATSQPLAGSGTIDSAALFDFQTDGDQVFNNMAIFYEPPQVVNLTPTNNAVYVNPAGGLSFDVTSMISSVQSNAIHLILNGVVQTGSSWTVMATDIHTNHVVLNTPLQNNTIYNGTITATDANGNSVTNNFTFNTWLDNNLFIEAEDYNFINGHWINNFIAPRTQNYSYLGTGDPNGGQFGTNGIDYLEYDPTGTNHPSYYRTNDLPQTEICTDTDHNQFASNGYQDFNVGYINNGEWLNYTRNLSNVTYTVYARMAGFGASPVMLMERTASPTATSTNQPRASLGTFVSPQTGGPQSWGFVQLKDFFSNPVQIRLPGTNTFRLTDLGNDGSYNLNYLILVASTNNAALHPYLASGYPYPGVTGVQPDSKISFVIANSSTNLVVPANIQVFLNSTNITSGATISNNAAGATVNYLPPSLLPAGTNTLKVAFSDSSIWQTNTWEFTVDTLQVIPAAYALPLNGSYAPGFAGQIAKAADSATNIDFPATIGRALAQLAGTLTNSQTLLPYANLAAGPNNDGSFVETNTINYDITGAPSGSWTFGSKTNFPYVSASGTNNFIAMAVNMYLALSPGVHTFAVRSDDGFTLTAGLTPTSTNMTLGIFDAGRGNGSPTTFSFIVQTNGLYPMRLVYDQAEFGGNIEFYSINRTNGISTLINDLSAADSVKAYRLAATVPIPLALEPIGNTVVLTWGDASFTLQAAPLVTGTFTNVPGATSPYTNVIGGGQKYFRLIH